MEKSDLFEKLTDLKTPDDRRGFLKKRLNIKLSKIKKAFVNEEKDIHCENLIGETTLPLGVVGPLKVIGYKLKVTRYFVPLATTEGALVASVNRGCKAITVSGGVKVFVEKIGATRAPVYFTVSLEKGFWFVNWLKKNEAKIKKAAEATSSHLKLVRFKPKVIGPYTYIRFYFDTSEAMGMNMATIATEAINQVIKKEAGIECLSLSGNFCTDKKPAWINFIEGKGFVGWAEVVISEKVIKEVLKSHPARIWEVWLAKCLIGSAMSGSLGFNSHFANIIAAFYAATGQDLAHVVEGSLGITVVRQLANRDLYFSVYLPSIMLGTVGGGTKLAVKKEALSIIGAKKTEELAEVLIGTVLAGEISLLASLAEGSLAKVHKRLGR